MSTDEQRPKSPERELEEQTEEFQRRIEELGDDVTGVRQDWERKRADPGVPGANPPPKSGPDSPAGAPSGGAGKADAGD